MHQINVSEQLFQEAQRRARKAGFKSVDDYVDDVMQREFVNSGDLDYLFTPERLAKIDEGMAQIRDGKGMTMEEVEVELARGRQEWLRRRGDASKDSSR